MTDELILVLFHAYKDFLDTLTDDSQETSDLFAFSHEFFRRLQSPGYRLTNGERENALLVLNRFIKAHPASSLPQQTLYKEISSGLY